MDNKKEQYINYVVNDLYENTHIDHYNQILRTPFYFVTSAISFLIDIGYGNYSPRYDSDRNFSKYIFDIYGINDKSIGREVWKNYMKKLEHNLNETTKPKKNTINENNKKEQLKNRILNDLLDRFPINPKRVTQSHDDNYYKIFNVLRNEYGINDSTILGKFYNLYISKLLNLPSIDSRIELVFTNDPYTNLKPGDIGTVTGYYKTPWGYQLDIKWDNGSSLQLIPGIDEWEVLS